MEFDSKKSKQDTKRKTAKDGMRISKTTLRHETSDGTLVDLEIKQKEEEAVEEEQRDDNL